MTSRIESNCRTGMIKYFDENDNDITESVSQPENNGV